MYVLEFSIVTITAFVAALNEVTKLIFKCVDLIADFSFGNSQQS